MHTLKGGATVPQNGQVSPEVWSILQSDPDKLQNKFDFHFPETEPKSPTSGKVATERKGKRQTTAQKAGHLTIQQIIEDLRNNPDKLQSVAELLKHQPDNPATPDKEAAEENDEREKVLGIDELYRPVASFDFPNKAHPRAFHGIAGKLTKLICEGTENRPEAVLTQFLCAFGNMLGRGPYKYQDKRHGTLINVVVVGPTSGGAKGSSWEAVRRLIANVSSYYNEFKITKGHNSAEAILEDIRDEVAGKGDGGREEVKEEAEPDKRLLIMEEEITRLFTVSQRGGTPLSEFIREFFDHPECQRAQSRKSKLKATKPHLSLMGHVTPEGLRESLKTVELFNGMANRMLFIASQRTRSVPRPPVVDWTTGEGKMIVAHLRHLQARFHPKNESIKNPDFEFDFTEEATHKWDEIYYRLEGEYKGKTGLHGAIVARWKPFLLRLALIYAALDLDTTSKGFAIDVCHLEAAEALWRYAADSAVWAFGLNSGNKNADKILGFLARRGEYGASKSLIRLECFQNHIATADLDESLAFLKNAGYAKVEHSGKRETWFKC